MHKVEVVPSNLPAALSAVRLLWVLALTTLLSVMGFALGSGRPGDPWPQLAALMGVCCCLIPAFFSWHKRAAGAARPRAWFVAHVLCSLMGLVLLSQHVRGGNLVSPPGLVFAALVFLSLQGVFARALLGRPYARLFARSASAFSPAVLDRSALSKVIEAKRRLLAEIDSKADEAVFSLRWNDWFKHPVRAWHFAALARHERRLVGSTVGVSPVLQYWRRLHIAVAVLFLMGLLLHVVVVLFFAGYVAVDAEPYWWHIFAWGGKA